jgi:hypothetical protein
MSPTEARVAAIRARMPFRVVDSINDDVAWLLAEVDRLTGECERLALRVAADAAAPDGRRA